MATSTASTTTSDFEDFIKSEKFLGDDSLFVRYGFFEDENEALTSDTNEIDEIIEEEFGTPTDINDSQGSDFNINSDSNIATDVEQNLTNEGLEQFLLSLPNQIRALFLYQHSFVKKLKGAPSGDLIRNLKTQAVMNINYFKLVKVEILDGYEVSESGEIMINHPKFRFLKKQDIDTITDIKFCRVKRFYDNNLMIKRDILTFPIENQHFFIRPTAAPSPIVYETKQERAKNISIKHFLSKKYNLLGSTSNIIKQPEDVPASEPRSLTSGDDLLNTGTAATAAKNRRDTGGY
jgi:hypothetical protein